jgi:hypothetical protein
MPKITLKPLLHREQECIGIYFEHNTKLNGAIQKYAGAKWSQSKKVWYIPLSKGNYNKLFFAVKDRAEIDQSELYDYLAPKKRKVILPVKPSVINIKYLHASAAKMSVPVTTIRREKRYLLSREELISIENPLDSLISKDEI